ncbi:glycosyltransferase, partial [Candidatus Omnitrophota bacterium]
TIPAWAVSKIKNVPMIFDMDDWDAREDIGYYFGVFPKSKAEHLTRIFASKCIFCIASSLFLRDYLSRFNKKVYYLPTGVDMEKFSPSAFKENVDFTFSWHGSVNRVELLEYLKFIIDCFLTLHGKYSFLKLHIAGDGVFGERLAELIKGYSCENLEYRGGINHEDIPDYLDRIDVGLVPLLGNSYFNLSKSPVKLFEYMAMRKPTVSSNIGEAAHIIKDGVNGFLADTKEEFIAKMEKLIENSSLRRQMGVSARDTIEKNYSHDVLEGQLYDILSSIK